MRNASSNQHENLYGKETERWTTPKCPDRLIVTLGITSKRRNERIRIWADRCRKRVSPMDHPLHVRRRLERPHAT